MRNADSDMSSDEGVHDKIEIQPFDADFFANEKPMVSDFQDVEKINKSFSKPLFSSNAPSFGGQNTAQLFQNMNNNSVPQFGTPYFNSMNGQGFPSNSTSAF